MILGLLMVGARGATPPEAPIRALYITGGGWHEFKALAPLLTSGISRFANVTWQIAWETPTMRPATFADGFDVVVYNGCFDDTKEPVELVNALRIIRDGKPAVMIHCAAHSFKYSDDWTAAVGLRTRKHDDFRALTARKVEPDNPIIRFWPASWSTTGDEMYQNIDFPASSTALLTVHSVESDKDHVVAWTHVYGKGRVFGTTLGHGLETASQADYQHLLANGLLWAAGKLES